MSLNGNSDEQETEDCPVCNGTGHTPYEDGKMCTNCAWTGKVKKK